MKLLILGHARHGKDSVAEILRDLHGISFISSSLAACALVVFPVVSERYETIEECFADRANHRAEWHQLICDYNYPNKSKLAKEILETNDCYVGMRCVEEYEASKHLFDFVLWVDASKRLPLEPISSMTIEKDDGMIVIENNTSYRNLVRQVKRTYAELSS